MQVRITNGMLIGLIINMMYSKAVGVTQGVMAREVSGDIWMSTILSIIQGMVIMYITIWIIKRQPEKNLSEHVALLTSTWVSKLISVLLFLFFLGAYSTVVATFIYHTKDHFLPETPLLSFIVTLFVIGVFSVYHGLEVAGRMALIGVFSVIALNILIIIGTFDQFDIRELMPVFQSGFLPTLLASRHHNTDWAMATLMTAMILPLVKEKAVWSYSGLVGMFYGGILILLWSLLEVGSLSSEVTRDFIVSCLQLARGAEIGLYIHRYEMIMLGFFSVTILTQIIMCIFCASFAAAQVLGLRDFRPTVIPVSLLLSGFSYWIIFDHTRAMSWLEDYWPMFAAPLSLFLPLSVWLLGFVRKKQYKKRVENTS